MYSCSAAHGWDFLFCGKGARHQKDADDDDVDSDNDDARNDAADDTTSTADLLSNLRSQRHATMCRFRSAGSHIRRRQGDALCGRYHVVELDAVQLQSHSQPLHAAQQHSVVIRVDWQLCLVWGDCVRHSMKKTFETAVWQWRPESSTNTCA